MPRRPVLLLLALLLASPLATASDPLTPELRRALDAAAPGEAIEAYLVMADQLRLADFDGLPRQLGARGRRALVAERLKAHAQQSQAAVRAVLAGAQAEGRAELTHVLWMGNALYFKAQHAVFEALAAVPGVDRIRPIVDLPASEQQDLGPVGPAAPPAPLGPGAGSYPFFDDFESGVLEPHWTAATTADGYVSVTGSNGPVGDFHVIMASAIDGNDSTASITVTLDLAGQTDVGIRFRHKEFGDEAHPEDGVFASENGVDWFRVLPLETSGSNYDWKALELDGAAAQFGLTYDSDFHIRFQWRDNFNLPTDGFAFDDIEIAPGVGVQPPPEPQPNLVALQAPLLWDRGFDGTGILIGNIDSGVWVTHPDLADRMWQNPGELGLTPGVDDDGNGFIDDIFGWDFINNTADPTSGDSHGTQSAGIAVGDGTAGQQTGMAPGATMVACEVSGETQYWAAQQYLLDVGVDVITSSYSYKWPTPRPDYHMHRQMCVMELAAGIIHANSIGNQGSILSTYPIPFNISTPGNCPAPFRYLEAEDGDATSVMGCGGITLPDDLPYTSSGRGPSAWDDILLYDAAYPWTQDPSWWDYPYGGFAGGSPGLMKPDVVTYTVNIQTTSIGSGYSTFGGTSAATPHLGGAMCLLRQAQPNADPRHLAAALMLTATDLGLPGKDTQYGAGKIQCLKAAKRLVVVAAFDDPTPTIGGNVTLNLYGPPNEPIYGFAAAGLLAVPGLNWNMADPYVFVGVFPLDANGEFELTVGLPNDPLLVDLDVWTQFGFEETGPSIWGTGPTLSVPERITPSL